MIARLLEATDIADEVRHFVFEVQDTEKFEFIAGQFVSLHSIFDDKKITRAYSIASSPQSNIFELCLNRVKEGRLSPWLFKLQIGDTLDFTGPLGYFVLRHPVSDSIMIATGTGISPFRSMLRTHVAAHPDRQFTLIFGVRFEGSIMYRDEFEMLARDCPNFRFWPTLSRPEPGWQGRSGHVQTHLDEALNGRTHLDVYICGLKLMVDDVRGRLKTLGFERKQIIFEKYD